ncbi:unnamed protein product, partial [Ectocarpus sp. 12 AP-2014]
DDSSETQLGPGTLRLVRQITHHARPKKEIMEVLNINVGILGHVDCGKTSLVKALSTVLSTASLDKNPQSRERGITLDLGFSAFT